ncbi:MAG: M20/M25/M40 family metallo-hydrolase [Rubrivivax sp.]
MMRTTTAMTILNAGNKENVLPGRADGGGTSASCPATPRPRSRRVKRVIADDRIEVTPLGVPFEASHLASPEAAGYKTIERAVREIFPDALVAPGLMLPAASDARHFDAIADNSYRFMPIRFKPEDLARPHGTDERIGVDQLGDMVRFYHRLLHLAAGPAPQGTQP